jgi:flagellar biosynthesis protein FlhG
MSTKNATEWLMSHKRFDAHQLKKIPNRTYSIAVTSGKGGVGKTSVSIKMAKVLAEDGYRVLLVDFDTNLSNTAIKLGLPINDNFYDLLSAKKSFEDCIYSDGNFHLLSACNGNMNMLDNEVGLDKIVIDIMGEHENEYDFILLDCPAGLSKESLSLSAYCDFRFVVVTPDRSSITDSYSLIKILNQKYGVTENHLLLNKVSSNRQYERLVKSLSETVSNFLTCRLEILGGLSFENLEVDHFDRLLLKDAGSKIHKNFLKVVKRFTEKDIGTSFSNQDEKSVRKETLVPYAPNNLGVDDLEQDVQQGS